MRRISCFMIGFVFVVGCSPISQQQIIPSQTLSIVVPTITSSVTPAKTLTPIPSLTWTPLPTIHPEDLQQVILDLFNTNKGCEYPCWWGIRPGDTDWLTAKAFLDTLSPTYWQPDTKEFTTVTFSLPDNWDSDSEGWANLYVRDDVVLSIRAFTYYSIADVLAKYGEPDEIWIEYHEDELSAPHYSFYMALGYFDSGFMITYYKQVLHNDENHICPYRLNEPEIRTDGYGKVHKIDHDISSLSLWNPFNSKSFTDIITEHYPSWNEFYIFRPLEEITNLDVNQFVDIYRNPNTRSCIEIIQ